MADRFFVGNSGNWNDTTHWSLTSGGTSGAAVPGTADDVYFDANSFSLASQTVTMSKAYPCSLSCKNINWTGVSGTPTWYFDVNSVTGLYKEIDLDIYGDATCVGSMVVSATEGPLYSEGPLINFSYNGNQTFNPAGLDFGLTYFFFWSSGTKNLAGDLGMSQGVAWEDRTSPSGDGTQVFNTNGYDMTSIFYDIYCNNGGAEHPNSIVINMGSSNIYIGTTAYTNWGAYWDLQNSSNSEIITLNAQNSNLIINDGNGGPYISDAFGNQYNKITVNGFGTAGGPSWIFNGGNGYPGTPTINQLILKPDSYLQFTPFDTTEVPEWQYYYNIGTLTANGNAYQRITIDTETSGSPALVNAGTTSLSFVTPTNIFNSSVLPASCTAERICTTSS